MRQYRGLTKDGKWVYGWYVEAKTCSVIIPQNCHVYEFLSDGIEVIPETVGQQTGLKDKNGKEIYEGDILKYAGLEGNIIVKWETFGWRLENAIPEIDRYIQRLSWPPIQLPSGNFEHIEIIGNIHTTPKLLKETK